MRPHRGSKVALAIALIASTVVLGGKAGAEDNCATAGPGGDWPVFGKVTSASRFQDQETVIGPDNAGQLEPAWVFPAEGTFESGAVADGGCVFIGSQSGDVYALNIEDGSLVWHVELSTATTLSIANRRVFVQSGPVMTALDQSSGDIVWQRDFSPGAGYASIGSPLAFEDKVVAGLTGCIDFGARPAPCRGYYAFLDQATGATMKDGYDVSLEDVERGMEGAGFWSQPTYDPEDKRVYFGTANTRSANPENPTSNALLQIDADPASDTYGEILGYFREPLNPVTNDPALAPVCGVNPAPVGVATSVVCIDDDDWPSSAVIYRDSDGRTLVGSTHSASILPVRTFASFVIPTGNYFAIDPTDMSEVWRSPSSGARAAVAAYDGERIYHSSGYNGEVVAVDKDDGSIIWTGQTYGGNNWQHVSAANGVVYALGSTLGMLIAFDASDGTPLVERQMTQDIGQLAQATQAGGITIARNTVLVPVNGGGAGHLVAYTLSS